MRRVWMVAMLRDRLAAALRAWVAAYSGLPRQVWWIALATFVNRSGTMVLPFLMLWLVRERGIETASAGALLSLWGFGAIGSAILGGLLTDRFGPKRVAVAALAAGSVGFVLLGRLQQPAWIGAGLFLQALVYETLRPATSAALAAHAPEALRTRAMAANRLAVNLGTAFGVVVGGEIAERDYGWIFWMDGATSAAAALLLACVLAPDGLAGALAGAPRRVIDVLRGTIAPFADRRFRWFAALTVVVAMVFFQGESTWMLYLRQQGEHAEGVIGRLMAINTAMIVALEMVIVHRLERRSPLMVAAWGALLTGLGFGLLALGADLAWAVASVAVFTFGEMLCGPFLGGWVARWGTDGTRGAAFGAFHLSWALAFAIAPFAGTALYDQLGPSAPWWGCALAGAVVAAGFAALGRDRRSSV